jgi:hypothetical protein
MRALQSTSTGTPSGAARRDQLATSETRSVPRFPGVGVYFTMAAPFVDLNEGVQSTTNVIRPRAGEKQVTIELERSLPIYCAITASETFLGSPVEAEILRNTCSDNVSCRAGTARRLTFLAGSARPTLR